MARCRRADSSPSLCPGQLSIPLSPGLTPPPRGGEEACQSPGAVRSALAGRWVSVLLHGKNLCWGTG